MDHLAGISVSSDPKPSVSVLVPTYQHAAYIEQCLDGILGQEFSGHMEVLIGEDGSTDGTREICLAYAAEHPDKVRVMERDRSDVIKILGRVTGRSNVLKLFTEARGKYIAICEGDDHWIDPLKLAKQIDFLERDPGYVLCATRAMLLRDGALVEHEIPSGLDLLDIKAVDLLRTYNFIATASVVYRRDAISLHDHHRKVPFLDLAMYLTVSQRGKMAMLQDRAVVYRITTQGLWSGLNKEQQMRSLIRFQSIMIRHLPKDQAAILRTKRWELLRAIARERFPRSPRRQKLYVQFLRLTLH